MPPEDPAEPSVTVDDLIDRDSDPDTDEDTFNHRFDAEGNVEPAVPAP